MISKSYENKNTTKTQKLTQSIIEIKTPNFFSPNIYKNISNKTRFDVISQSSKQISQNDTVIQNIKVKSAIHINDFLFSRMKYQSLKNTKKAKKQNVIRNQSVLAIEEDQFENQCSFLKARSKTQGDFLENHIKILNKERGNSFQSTKNHKKLNSFLNLQDNRSCQAINSHNKSVRDMLLSENRKKKCNFKPLYKFSQQKNSKKFSSPSLTNKQLQFQTIFPMKSSKPLLFNSTKPKKCKILEADSLTQCIVKQEQYIERKKWQNRLSYAHKNKNKKNILKPKIIPNQQKKENTHQEKQVSPWGNYNNENQADFESEGI